MVSLKRRRGIGIRKWLIDALKDYAKREGISSHTAVFNRILRGNLEPIRDYEKYKGDESRKGVSMQEELWLALKDYGERRGKGESDTKVACKILVGKIEPIPPQSLEVGKQKAKEREAERAKNRVVEKKVTEPSQEEIILEQREESSRRVNGKRPLSGGVPVTEKVFEKKINPDDESFGGVFDL